MGPKKWVQAGVLACRWAMQNMKGLNVAEYRKELN